MNHKNRLQRLLPIRILLSTVLLAGLIFPPQAIAEENVDSAKQKEEIVNLIINYHVSGIEIEQLDTENIDSVIDSLNDPYTQYFKPDEWKKFMDMLENNYTGIGIRVGTDDRGFYVNEVFPGTPAMDGGLQSGDYIVAVEGNSTEGKTTDQLISEITGIEGTKVQITIERDDDRFNVTMTRKAIHIPSITSRFFDNGTGYIRISSFSSDADELFAEKLKDMKAMGLQSLIIDLRNNPGGLLETAGNMATHFIKEGSLIHTLARDNKETPYPITGDHPLTVPVTILVNEYSASASEVLAGALQDYKLATLIGRKTFGKGSVQSLFNLSQGGMLKLTVQEYLTPLKHKVNQVGLSPDLEVWGDASQLITALQKAGEIDIRLTLGKHSLNVNGLSFNETFKVIRDENRVYVPSRVLTAIVDGDITWESSTRSVHIDAKQTTGKFDVGSDGTIIEDNISYIDLNHFQNQFASFDWRDDSSLLLLLESGRE